jgi:hypothetical protein
MSRKTHNPNLPFIIADWVGNPLNNLNQYVNLDGPSGEKRIYEGEERPKNKCRS